MPQQSPQHRIGDAARLSGVSAANIRYYEKEGLLRPGVRGDNSYRFYSCFGVNAAPDRAVPHGPWRRRNSAGDSASAVANTPRRAARACASSRQ